ncbi:MAG: glycosyltransferase family 39 protein [Anaerolineae bacterium]
MKRGSTMQHAPRDMKQRFAVWVLLALVLVLTVCLRWYRFATFPPGLFYDEAYGLMEAQRLVQGGGFQIYYPGTRGEPAFFWLTALALKMGAGYRAPRWVSAVSSAASVPLLFFAIRDILRRESEQADWLALGGAAALGVNYAYLLNSRMGWEIPLIVVTFIAAVWFFWRGMRDGRGRDFALAGLVLGAAQYVWVSARLLPLVFLLVLLGWLGQGWRWWRARWKGLLIACGSALLIYAPLAFNFLTHPEWFERKLRTAALASAILPNLGRTLAGWLWLGGAALHDLPSRPIYDPAMGFLLLLGIAVATCKIRRPAYNVWLAWFVGVLPAGFLSAPTPVFYRVLAAVPATAALCALGGYHLWRFVAPRLRNLALLLLLTIFAASAWATCYDFFVRWANWPLLPGAMDVGKWRAAEVMLNAPADETILVTVPDRLEPAITYALHARDSSSVRAFDGARCLIYPAKTDRPIHYLVILGHEHRILSRLQTLFPSGRQMVDPIFAAGAPYFVNFFVPAGAEAAIPGALPSPITYQENILLHGVHVPEMTLLAGQPFTVTLSWEILEPTSKSYTVFVHLLDGRAEAEEAPLVAQHDGLPCGDAEPTWRWRPGEIVLDEHLLTVPADLPAGEYLLGVGLYDSDTLEHLTPTGEDLLVRWSEAIVETITLTTSPEPDGEPR